MKDLISGLEFRTKIDVLTNRKILRIKRYPNRKLYAAGRYLTLKQVAAICKLGIDLEVLDINNDNITNSVLKQVLLLSDLNNSEMMLIIRRNKNNL